jgi:hypothetical protein
MYESVSDGLTPSEQFYSYILARTNYFLDDDDVALD